MQQQLQADRLGNPQLSFHIQEIADAHWRHLSSSGQQWVWRSRPASRNEPIQLGLLGRADSIHGTTVDLGKASVIPTLWILMARPFCHRHGRPWAPNHPTKATGRGESRFQRFAVRVILERVCHPWDVQTTLLATVTAQTSPKLGYGDGMDRDGCPIVFKLSALVRHAVVFSSPECSHPSEIYRMV